MERPISKHNPALVNLSIDHSNFNLLTQTHSHDQRASGKQITERQLSSWEGELGFDAIRAQSEEPLWSLWSDTKGLSWKVIGSLRFNWWLD